MTYFKSKLILPLVLILIVYFALRLQNILIIPVFGDEAIYLRWSQLIKNVETLRFVPLSDGKQPLFMWITAAAYKFIHDPLLAGRLISTFSGAGILIALYIFSLLFFNSTVAIFSSLIYLLLPFTFFFDRLALPDTLLSFFGVTSMLLAFLLARFPRLDLALLLGFSLGLAGLTKSPAIYFIVLSLFTFILYDPKNIKKIYLPLVSVFLAFIIYNILRLGPQFQQIALRNQDYVWSISVIIRHPLDPLIPHLKDVFNIFNNFISLPLFVLAAFGFYTKKSIILKNKTLFILFCWWILPLLANAAMAKVFTARYILFTLPSLILLLSVGIYYFFTKIKIYLIIFICFIPNLFWLYKLSTAPFNLKLSSTESGYISGWTSGWGIHEAANYLIDRSHSANVIVGTEGYFGTLPDGLQIYTDSIPHLTIFGVGINISEIPPKLIDARNFGDEVYLLFNNSRLHLTQTDLDKLILIKSFTKPDNDNLVLYRLK